MADWNAAQYLQFKEQRTQPARDLAARVSICPRRAADIGCGPGNSTSVLRERFPEAALLGIDSSANMIEKAQNSYPELDFRLCDVHALEGGWDLLFSNACLQWVPDHAALLPELMSKLNDGGVLAVQIPINGAEPLLRAVDEVAADPRWDLAHKQTDTNAVLPTDAYFDILAGCSRRFDLWETVYYHHMPSPEAMVEWVKGTRMRPYLAALSDEEAAAFEQAVLDRVKAQYAPQANGEYILRFRRLFFVAEK